MTGSASAGSAGNMHYIAVAIKKSVIVYQIDRSEKRHKKWKVVKDFSLFFLHLGFVWVKYHTLKESGSFESSSNIILPWEFVKNSPISPCLQELAMPGFPQSLAIEGGRLVVGFTHSFRAWALGDQSNTKHICKISFLNFYVSRHFSAFLLIRFSAVCTGSAEYKRWLRGPMRSYPLFYRTHPC